MQQDISVRRKQQCEEIPSTIEVSYVLRGVHNTQTYSTCLSMAVLVVPQATLFALMCCLHFLISSPSQFVFQLSGTPGTGRLFPTRACTKILTGILQYCAYNAQDREPNRELPHDQNAVFSNLAGVHQLLCERVFASPVVTAVYSLLSFTAGVVFRFMWQVTGCLCWCQPLVE